MKRARREKDNDVKPALKRTRLKPLREKIVYSFLLNKQHSEFFTLNSFFYSKTLNKKTEVLQIELPKLEIRPISTHSLVERESFLASVAKESIPNSKESVQMHIESTASQDNYQQRLLEAINCVLEGAQQKVTARRLSIRPQALKRALYNLRHDKPLMGRVGRPPKIREKIESIIRQYFREINTPFLSLRDIIAFVAPKLHMDSASLSLSTVRLAMRKCGYRRKKIDSILFRRNTLDVMKQRKEKVEELIDILLDGKRLIFIDETGFNTNVRPNYGWGRRGRRLVLEKLPQGPNHSVIGAITSKKLLGFKIFKGSMNTKDFGGFLIELLNKYEEIREALDQWVLVMDNVAFHKSKEIKPFLSNLRVFYLPPYSPFLNPIEEVFAWWKQRFRKLRFHKNISIHMAIIESIRSLSDHLLLQFYLHSFRFYADSVKMKHIY